MYALETIWDLGDRFDAAVLRRRAAERAPLFEALPGLVAKAFLVDEERRQFGAVYYWESWAHVDVFLASDLFASSRQALGEPAIRRFEVAAFVGPAADAFGVPPRRPSLNHAMVYVRDVRASLEFYAGMLGLRVIEEMSGYARLQSARGRTTIGLHQAEPDRRLPGSEGIRIYFETADLDPLCAVLAERGVSFLQPPKDMPWGWRHAYLLDPDGHEISLYTAGEKRFWPSEMP